MIRHWLQLIFDISLIAFMLGNLSAMGLQLRLADAWTPLRSIRFVGRTLFAGFFVSPALAYVVARIVPMEAPFATGLLLLGLAPSAPFLPLVVKKANGDLAAAAGTMLLASVGTIVIMPVAVPLAAPGLSADAWRIAKPLFCLVLIPLASGIFIKSMWPARAVVLHCYVKHITGASTIIFLAMVIVLNFKTIAGSVGSHALIAQFLYVPATAITGYLCSAGMPGAKRSVVSLGTCTRNIGIAAAIVGTDGDQRTMVMLVFATLVTLIVSFGTAAWFSRAGHQPLVHDPTVHRI